MIDEGLRKAVETLAREELQRASKIHPPFTDMHQGYAVIKEEIEECEEALNTVNNHLDYIWNYVKTDDLKGFKFEARLIKKYAMELSLEAIQVAAVAEKFMDILDSVEE